MDAPQGRNETEMLLGTMARHRCRKEGVAWVEHQPPSSRFGSPLFQAVLWCAAVAVGGCTSLRTSLGFPPPPPPPPMAAAAALDPVTPMDRFGGLSLSGQDDYVVRIVSPGTSCSGTLIADNLVLTAHHCVSDRDQTGSPLPLDVAPQEINVELGGGHFPWAEVGVRDIIAPVCGHAAGVGDLAVLVLDRRLGGVPRLRPDLDFQPTIGSMVFHIGFGRCALSDDGIYLKRREGGYIDLILPNSFRLNAPLCPGDSGGPVIDQTSGHLVGVVSAGAMDGNERTRDRVDFARLDVFRSLFANAAAVSRGVPASELPPVECPAAPPASGVADQLPSRARSMASR